MFDSHCGAALLFWKNPYARGALRVFKSGLRIGTVVVLVQRLPLLRPVGFIGILIHRIPVAVTAVAESLERGEYLTVVLSHPRSIPGGGEMVRGREALCGVLEEGSRAGRSQRNATRVASDRFTRSPSAQEERRMAGSGTSKTEASRTCCMASPRRQIGQVARTLHWDPVLASERLTASGCAGTLTNPVPALVAKMSR